MSSADYFQQNQAPDVNRDPAQSQSAKFFQNNPAADAAGRPGAGTPAVVAPGMQSFADLSAAAQAQASREIGNELTGQIDPLNRQISDLQAGEGQALGQIGSMFDHLQPVVQQGATAVQQSYDSAEQMQNQIFNQATTQLNNLKQQRAQDAQRLAQQMGGPVAVDEWTAGYNPGLQSLTELGAGEQLKTLAYAQAGVQAANAFAGQVFPVLRTEQTAQARNLFESQIKDIRGKIDDLNSQRSSLIDSRQHELLQQNLQYQLDQAKYNLDKLNASRDWQIQKGQLKVQQKQADHDWTDKQRQYKLDRATTTWGIKKTKADIAQAKVTSGLEAKRLKADIAATKATTDIEQKKYGLAEQQFAWQKTQEESGITGTYKGKPTLAAQKLTADEKRIAASMDMSEKEYQLRKQQLANSTSLANKKLDAAARTQAAEWLDAAISPSPGKTVKTSNRVEVGKIQAIKDHDAFVDPTSSTGYSKIVTTVQTPISEPISNPNSLVDYLISHNVAKSQAITMVRARLRIPSWDYGEKWPPKKAVKPSPAHASGKKPGTGESTSVGGGY